MTCDYRRAPLPSQCIPNTLPKHLIAKLGMERVMRLCKVQFQARVSRNPRCPKCHSTQTLWRTGTRDARCKDCGEVF
jgi:tRNA(Ile2) C34 agmatinyltransferase TiaS